MIKNSFIFLERFGKKREENLWNQDINNWDDFLKKDKIKGIKNKKYYNRRIIEARKALYNQESQYFLNKLPQAEMWRLYDFFKEEAVFLDIEVSSVKEYGDITVVGLFDGIDTKVMIRDINLDIDLLKKELKKYKLIVTFNGAIFDIPFLKKRYPDLIPNIPVFDLRVLCNRMGFTGGLKNIEKEFGIKRNKIIEKIYNGDPLLLWRMYKGSGDDYYLNLLVEYNEEDIINLKTIADTLTKSQKKALNIS